MKKIFILVISLVILGLPALSAEYTAQDKKTFYDNFLKGMFWGMEQSLAQQNVPEAKIKNYVSAMKKQVNRQQLENTTWPCVSKYTPEEMASQSDKVTQECFAKWATDYYTKNQNLIKLLK